MNILSTNKNLEAVSHPIHYNIGNIEVIDAINAWQLNFSRGNAVKYIARAGHKDKSKEIEDLKKAVWYIQHEISILEGKNEKKDTIDSACYDLERCYECKEARPCVGCAYNGNKLEVINILKGKK
jgi:hypothetical protein